MRKSLVLALCIVTWTATNAQELIKGSKFTDNWSVGINVGGVSPLSFPNSFFEDMRATMGFEVNKQLTPVFGLGLQGMWSVNTSSSSTAFDHSNISALGRVNMSNLICGYKGVPRLFEVETVFGIGWIHSYVNSIGYGNFISSKFGLNFNFNLGEQKAWTVAFKPAFLYKLEDDRHVGGYFNINNGAMELLAGVTYHFKGSNDARYMTLTKEYNQDEVDGLNSKINSLRSQLDNEKNNINAANNKINKLEAALDECRNRKPEVKTVTNIITKNSQTLESVVTFRQGKITVDASQLPNVERIATYMKYHPQSTVSIKGFASPEGKAEVNAKIARQRAEAVKNLLTKKFRIAATRITAEGQGVGNMFSEPDWNRVSICTLDEEGTKKE
ncbi:MAG: Outer membrane protein 41 [Parabacteroides sp.]